MNLKFEDIQKGIGLGIGLIISPLVLVAWVLITAVNLVGWFVKQTIKLWHHRPRRGQRV